MSDETETKTPVRHIEVSADDNGQRIDRWLKKQCPGVPFGLLQKLLRKGQIRIDSKRAKGDTVLEAGQTVRLPPMSTPSHSDKKKPPKLSDQDKAFIKELVIYEDQDIIALNKPAGLAVQGGTKTTRHVDRLLPALANKKDGVVPRLVHRLDKDTSGILLLARSAQAARDLGHMFKKRQIKKVYWALVSPVPDIPDSGSIKAPLAKSTGRDKELMVIDEEEGKFAHTDYEIIDKALNEVAFMAFWPQTGRTHQIRVHAQNIGAPLVGDRKYKQLNPYEEKPAIVTDTKHLHLHARNVSFKHPRTGKQVNISAPLPPALKASWEAFGFNPNHKDDSFADIEI